MSAGEPEPVGPLAEAAVLGAAMWSGEAARGAVEQLEPDMFSNEASRLIFGAIAALVAEGDPVDSLTVHDRMHVTGRYDLGAAPVDVYDVSRLESAPSPSAWRYYVGIVRREHDRRQAVRDLRAAIEALQAGEDPALVRAGLETTR